MHPRVAGEDGFGQVPDGPHFVHPVDPLRLRHGPAPYEGWDAPPTASGAGCHAGPGTTDLLRCVCRVLFHLERGQRVDEDPAPASGATHLTALFEEGRR